MNSRTVTDFVPSGEVPDTTVPPVPTGGGLRCGRRSPTWPGWPGLRRARTARRTPLSGSPTMLDVDRLGLVLVDQKHFGAGPAVRVRGRRLGGVDVVRRRDVAGLEQQAGVVDRGGAARRRGRRRGGRRGHAGQRAGRRGGFAPGDAGLVVATGGAEGQGGDDRDGGGCGWRGSSSSPFRACRVSAARRKRADHGPVVPNASARTIAEQPIWLLSRRGNVAFTNAGWSSSVARWAHNPEVAGSNPVPATRSKRPPETLRGPFSSLMDTCLDTLGVLRI